MHLTLRQLRYFVEIARCRSLSRAARQLAVAQPALSLSMAALEDELGQALLHRHARGVDLTDAGQRLYSQALQLLDDVHTLPARIRGEAGRPAGPVSVALAGSVAGLVVAPLLRSVAQRYPGIVLQVGEGLSSEIRRQVEAGQVQLALMPSPAELQGMATRPLFEERLMLVGPATGQASQRRSAVGLAQALRGPLAAPDRTHDLRKLLERQAAAAGLVLDVRHELNSPQMLLAVVREGLARAILPLGACHDAIAAGHVVGRPLRDAGLCRVQALVWPADRGLSPAAQAVADVIDEVVADLLTRGLLLGRPLPAPADTPADTPGAVATTAPPARRAGRRSA